MVAIGELSYQLTANVRNFEAGMVASRKELSQTRRVMKETEDSTERYAREQQELDNLLQKGLITRKEYNRALENSKRKLDDATKSTKKAERGFEQMVGVVRKVTVALAALEGARRLVATEFDRVDEIQKTSRFLGMATDELIGFRLAAFETAGMAEGQVSVAIQRMVRRISEAAQGAGEAQGAIRELGLSAQELAKGSPEQALRKIADAMRQIPNESDRIRLAFKLFDSEGARLGLTLGMGSKEIDKFVDKAKDLGLVFSGEEGRAVEEANDALKEMNESLKGIAGTISRSFAPVLRDLSKALRQTTDDFMKSPFSKGGAFGALLGIREVFQPPELNLTRKDTGVAGRLAKVADELAREQQNEDDRAKKRDEILQGLRDDIDRKLGQVIKDGQIDRNRIERLREERDKKIETIVKAFDNQRQRGPARFDRLGGGRGSVEEFQALAAIRNADLTRREQLRLDRQAEQDRKALIRAINTIPGKLEEVERAIREGQPIGVG